MKFIHISDLHFCVDPKPAALKPGLVNNQRAVADIIERFGDAEFCVATGDIVSDPDEGAYRLAAETYADMPMPMHFIPGNHDDRQMAYDHLPNMRFDDEGFLQKVEEFSFGVGLFLDTIKLGSHGGEYCPKRQAWLKQQLSRYAGEPLFIFMHHAPFATGLPAMDTMRLDPAHAEQVGALLASHTGPKQLFFGHYHRAFSGLWKGMAFSCVPSMIVQIGLEVESFDRSGIVFEPPQYAVVLADADRSVVHYHQYASGLSWSPIPKD